MKRYLLVAILVCLPISAGVSQPTFNDLEPAAYGSARYAGYVAHSDVTEASGIAFSRIDPNRIWLHNDGGHSARIYASTSNGRPLGALKLKQVKNQDWEDLAAFTLADKPMLAVADIGDNGGLRKTITVHFVVEPENVEKKMSLAPEWSTVIRYPDGPHDCEAMAIDPDGKYIYLLTKRAAPALLFRAPLRSDDADPVEAELVGKVDKIPQPTAELIAAHPRSGRYRSQPTAMDFDPANRQAAVLTYHYAYVFDRLGDEDWPAAFARKPKLIRLPLLPQGEAIAYNQDGSALYVTSEKWPSPILRLIRD